jgi:hypothetical protein
MEPQKVVNEDHNKLWKQARIGLIIGCLVHYFIMIIVKDTTHLSPSTSGAPAILSFFICRWFIRYRIEKNGQLKLSPLFGFSCAMVVFGIQLIIGTFIFPVIADMSKPKFNTEIKNDKIDKTWSNEYEMSIRLEFMKSKEIKALKYKTRKALADCFILKIKNRFPRGLENYPQREMQDFLTRSVSDCVNETAIE